MAGNKKWTDKDNVYLVNLYNELKTPEVTDDELFDSIMDKFPGRTVVALNRQYYKLTNGKGAGVKAKKERVIHKVVPAHTDFLEAIQDLKNSYEAVYTHNVQLRKRVDELEHDYQMMAKIMEQARKMVVAEALGEHEKSRFKMDQNGNLNRV
jgi:hypothetical protein